MTSRADVIDTSITTSGISGTAIDAVPSHQGLVPLYPTGHPNAKYRSLNSLPFDVMDGSEDANFRLAGLCHDIHKLNEKNNVPTVFHCKAHNNQLVT